MPGNKKRTHLYNKYFTPSERLALKTLPENDLSGEINLLRIVLSRFFQPIESRSPADLQAQLNRLRAVSTAASVIGALIRTHTRVHNPLQELESEIEQGLHLARMDLGILDYLKYEGEQDGS